MPSMSKLFFGKQYFNWNKRSTKWNQRIFLFYFCRKWNRDKEDCRNVSQLLHVYVLHTFKQYALCKCQMPLINNRCRADNNNMSALITPDKMSGQPSGEWSHSWKTSMPRSREIRLFFLLCLSSDVSLRPMGPAPSWHPGGTGSPASLWGKGGEREGWEGRKEERMNQNPIKGTVTFLRAQGQLIRGGLG